MMTKAEDRAYATAQIESIAKQTEATRERIEAEGGWSTFDVSDADISDVTWAAAEAKGAAEWLSVAYTLLNEMPEGREAIRRLCEVAEAKQRLYQRMLLASNSNRYEKFRDAAK